MTCAAGAPVLRAGLVARGVLDVCMALQFSAAAVFWSGDVTQIDSAPPRVLADGEVRLSVDCLALTPTTSLARPLATRCSTGAFTRRPSSATATRASGIC